VGYGKSANRKYIFHSSKLVLVPTRDFAGSLVNFDYFDLFVFLRSLTCE